MNSEEMKAQEVEEKVVHCPECGSPMDIDHSSHEGSCIFIWYQCPESECHGQWLHRVPSTAD